MLLEKELYLNTQLALMAVWLTGADQSVASFANYSLIAKLIPSLVCYLAQ